MRRCLLLVLLALALASCAQVPREHLAAFQLRFEAARELSEKINADNSKTESRVDTLREALAESGSSHGFKAFNSESIRGKKRYVETYAAIWQVLSDYMKVLESLATGKPTDELSLALSQFTSTVLDVAQTALAAYGAGALVEPFKALADLVIKAQAAERFRTLVMEVDPLFQLLLDGLEAVSKTLKYVSSVCRSTGHGTYRRPVGSA